MYINQTLKVDSVQDGVKLLTADCENIECAKLELT